MVARLEQEHLDAIVYGHTLREQLRGVIQILECETLDPLDMEDRVADAAKRLRAILEDQPVD